MSVIVVVAMLDSVHTFRWMQSAIHSTDYHYVLSPSGPHRKIHPSLAELAQDNPSRLRIVGSDLLHGAVFFLLDKTFSLGLRRRVLQNLIDEVAPVAIHAMEIQHAGYLCHDVVQGLESSSGLRFMVSNWGSDIYWFKQYEKHKAKICQVLGSATHYSAECKRDYELARAFGFGGVELPVVPNSARFDHLEQLNLRRENRVRKQILVKGYQGWSGQSWTAIFALHKLREKIIDFQIIVYSASLSTRVLCWFLGAIGGYSIKAFPKHYFSQEEMKRQFLSSALYIGISRTDGLSTSALEAMAYGAIPIQSSTSCLGEILPEGHGVLVQNNSIGEVCNDILVGLGIYKKRGEIVIKNQQLASAVAGKNVIDGKIGSLYSRLVRENFGGIH